MQIRVNHPKRRLGFFAGALGSVLLTSTAFAQTAETSASAELNPGVELQSAPPAGPPPSEEIPAEAKALAGCSQKKPAQNPASAHILSGDSEYYSPLLNFEGTECSRLQIPISAHLSGEALSSFPVDRYGNKYDPGVTLRPRVRLGAQYNTGLKWKPFNLNVEYEHDLLTGITGSDPDFAGEAFPAPVDLDHQLRKANFRLSIAQYLHFTAGWMTSHWGLGLVANDGAHGWTPGSASFSNPIGGDRNLGVQLATGPLTDLGLMIALGGSVMDHDLWTGDETLLEGDEARQFVAAVLLGEGKKHGGGIYAAYRQQEMPDGKETNVLASDIYLRSEFPLGGALMKLQGEAVWINGTTELAPTADFEEYTVNQFGAALRGELDFGKYGSVVDFMYASGDANLDDDNQNAFRADPNYELGLFIFRQVLAAQTARGSATAGDRDLVGIPADDLDRIPTRGSVTNTLAIFPRLRVRPTDGLEIYGGALFAFAAQNVADPFNTRVDGGGSPRNALNAIGSKMLGTEYDLGARYRLNISGAEATLGAEAGVFTPSGALTQADGQRMPSVGGARLILDVRM